MRRSWLVGLLGMLLVLVAGSAYADGILFPMDPEVPERFLIQRQPQQNFTVPLSVRYHKVKVDIKENAAETFIDQAFFNHLNRVIEGLYIFPLPVGASISGFAMDIEGKMTKGELLDADKARSIYEDIVRKMQDPALLEYMGTGLFKTRIYPIEPLKEKQIKLNYQEALRIEGDLVRYVYPLNTEKYSQEPLKQVAIEAKITAKSPITTVYSPSHKIQIKRESDTSVIVGFEAENVKPDKDFVLYYALSKKDVSLSLLTHRPDASEDGTFMVMLSPRTEIQEKSRGAKNVAFVFDTSGSMAGNKMNQARKALEFCINSLKPGDRFFLESFATDVNPYKSELIELTDQTRAGALEYVKGLEAVGGTNISEALTVALKALHKGGDGKPSFVVFMTDGQPTAGLTEPNEITREIKTLNSSKSRLFVFGVGDNVNTALLDQLAEEHGGISDYVGEAEDIEVKVSDLFTKLSHPVMVDVSLDFHHVEVSQIYPQRLPDLFKGSHLTMLGRYKKPGEGRITLSGTVDGQPVKMDFEGSFPEKETGNGFVSRIWATRKIGFLLDQIRKNGSSEELRTEIVALAKRFGILTPYTSFLVVEDKPLNAMGPDLSRVMQPEGEGHLKRMEEMKSSYSMDRFKMDSAGADAVDAAREVQAMKSMDAPAAAPSMSNSLGSGFSGSVRSAVPLSEAVLKAPITREVGERTFYFIDEKWMDSSIRGEKPVLTVKAYSAAYFALVAKYPEVGKFLALGDRIVIQITGKTIEISPESGISATDELSF
jgi:Ca-activated chloride channel family protein